MNFNYKELIDNVQDGVYFTDTRRKIIYWNNASETITGYTSEDIVGCHCFNNILLHIDDNARELCKGGCPLEKTIRDGKSRKADVYLHHRDGHRVPVRIKTVPLKDENGNTVGGAEFFRDISSQEASRQRLDELQKLALLDSLTQLSNRHHLNMSLEKILSEKQRYDLQFGILFIDIDHFKNINDTYGHDVGDRVLKTIAKTLNSAARPFDLFGRWGGEEFMGIIRNVDLTALTKIGNRCRVLIEKSTTIAENQYIRATVSIGATVIREEDTVDTLVKRADKLLYQSKRKGRNCLCVDTDLLN